MELQIRGRNVEINNQIRSHVEEKLGQLGRHLPGLSRVAVELSSESTRSQGDRVVAQVTLDISGSILRAEQRASNTRAAINSAAEVLGRRIERYKSQAYRSERARQGSSLGAVQAEEAEEPQSQAGSPVEGQVLADGNLVRIKRFDMNPMTVDEAALQMQQLGHQFFMFLNVESGRHNVLYQRDDGNFGLIEPSS